MNLGHCTCSFRGLCIPSQSLLEVLVAITGGDSTVYTKRQKFPQIVGLIASKCHVYAFTSSFSLAADLSWIQNVLQKRAELPVPVFSPYNVFKTVNWFLPRLAGKMVRNAASVSKETAAAIELQLKSPPCPRAGDNFLLLSDFGLFSSFLKGYQSFPFCQPGPSLKLCGDPSWPRQQENWSLNTM